MSSLEIENDSHPSPPGIWACCVEFLSPLWRYPWIVFPLALLLGSAYGVPYYYFRFLPRIDVLIAEEKREVDTIYSRSRYELGIVSIEVHKESGPYDDRALKEHWERLEEFCREFDYPDFRQKAKDIYPTVDFWNGLAAAKNDLADTQAEPGHRLHLAVPKLAHLYESVPSSASTDLDRLYQDAGPPSASELERIWRQLQDFRDKVASLQESPTDKAAIEACMASRKGAILLFTRFPRLPADDRKRKSIELFGEDLRLASRLIAELAKKSGLNAEDSKRLTGYAESLNRRERFLGYLRDGEGEKLFAEMDGILGPLAQ
jgi:hypothetical protein